MFSKDRTAQINFRFSVLQITFFAMLFISEGLLAQFLNLFGYGDSFIGIVMMSIGISSLVFQPILGYICDRFLNFRAVFLCAYGAAAATMPLFFRFGSIKAVALIYSLVILGLLKSMFGMLDSWITKLQRELPKLNYGKLRAVGSIAYAVASVVVAQVIMRFGIGSSVWQYILMFVVMAAAVISLPNPSRVEDGEKVSLASTARVLLKNRNYMVFQLCAFLVWLSGMSVILFSSRLISDLGGDVGMIGIVYAVMALSEVLVISNFSKLSARIGIENILIIGMFGMAVKNVLWGICPTPEWVIFASLSQAVSYAVIIPAAVQYIDREIPKEFIASAMVIYHTLGLSMAQVLGSPLYGALSERFGVSGMILLAAIPGFIGATIFTLYSKCKKTRG